MSARRATLKPGAQVFRVVLRVRAYEPGAISEVPLWVIAQTAEHAIARARRHARGITDDPRPRVSEVKLVGTIDVP